jgi:aldose 1-epimerase
MLSVRPFGKLPDGRPVEAYTLANATGHALEVLTYGGIVRTHLVPARDGRLVDVVHGFNDLAGYLACPAYLGAIIGRVAGRVPGGRLIVDGRPLPVARNEQGRNHTHGGHVGFDKRIWSAAATDYGSAGAALALRYLSPAGEEGHPGELDVTVTYELSAAGTFTVRSAATTDAPTPLSLAHHAYYNLSGEASPDLYDHECQIWADGVANVDATMTPLGRTSLDGHAADLRAGPRILRAWLPTLHQEHGDLYFLHPSGRARPPAPVLAARLRSPATGITLEAHTDEACLQFYSGSKYDGKSVGKSGRAYARHSGFCLECQGYPGATEHPEWGDIIVRPGETQTRTTHYKFGLG